jgi:hypothetical protein
MALAVLETLDLRPQAREEPALQPASSSPVAKANLRRRQGDDCEIMLVIAVASGPSGSQWDRENTPQNPCGTGLLAASHLCLKLVGFERISSRPAEEGWWHYRLGSTW